MVTILCILGGCGIALVVARMALGAKYEQERLTRRLTAEEEAYFELDQDVVTPENVGVILEYQMMKHFGEVSEDHPAILVRKKLSGPDETLLLPAPSKQ